MRITYGMMAQTSLRNIEQNATRMATYENQLTSNSKINVPSDDPVGVARALSFQGSIDQSNQILKNIDQGTNFLNTTDSTLSGVQADVQRARELAVQAANGTLSPQDKTAIQSEITQLQASVLDLSNSKIGGSYIFSGTKSDNPGYLLAVSSAQNPAAYQGNAGSIQREVSPGVTVGVNANAQATFDPIFKALSTLQDGLASQAGAPATSSAAVVAGTGAGPVGTGGSLMLNGVNISIASAATPAAVMATINGTVALQGASGVTASLSVAPGPVGNLVLTSNTVGSAGVVSVGNALPAGNTIATDLGLTSGSSLKGQDNAVAMQARLQQSLTDLDGAIDSVNVARSGVGAKMNRLETLQGQQTSVNTNLQGLLSQVKDVDMASAITSYTAAQTVYQASLKSAAQSIQPSLLDFLK